VADFVNQKLNGLFLTSEWVFSRP